MRAGLWCWIGGCGTVGWDTESAILLSLAFYSMPLSLYLAVHRTFIPLFSALVVLSWLLLLGKLTNHLAERSKSNN